VSIGNVDLPQQNEVKCLGMHLDRKLVMGKAREDQKKIPQRRSETNVLATRMQINIINSKQTPI
jgi:hypothetical protein